MTMYLDDSLTSEELSDATREQRETSRPAANAYNLPFKAYASPATLRTGDMIAMYAGNDSPAYAVTFDHLSIAPWGEVTVVTSDGPYVVPVDSRLWVAAWAPMNDGPTWPDHSTCSETCNYGGREATYCPTYAR
jgi:hypothetical protein